MAKYKPKSRDELRKLVKDNNIYLGDIDTSNVTNMGGLFIKSDRVDFSGIELWDTSKVVDMRNMFNIAERFNQPLDNWDTSSVEFMTFMFLKALSFNQNLDSWNVSNVCDNQKMFENSGITTLPKWHKNTPLFSDLDDYFSMIEVIEKVVEKAKATLM